MFFKKLKFLFKFFYILNYFKTKSNFLKIKIYIILKYLKKINKKSP